MKKHTNVVRMRPRPHQVPAKEPAPFAEMGARLQAYRAALGYETSLKFTGDASINYQGYSPCEAGTRRLSLEMALSLYKHYGISLDFIYFGRYDAVPTAHAASIRDHLKKT